ncbi:hypothetical protein [Paenibacillus amylolyticus]|uniref:hypothetical protein n=1 Tax=Paenibacillus amylolyticus TaxID=1451 RepID=UPI0033923BF0
MITSYISLAISAIALSLGLYNWKQSLIRFRATVQLEEVLKGCWNVKCTVTNDSSRSTSIIKAHIYSGEEMLNHIAATPIKNGKFMYKMDGESVAIANEIASFPLNFAPYETKVFNRIVTSKPGNQKSYLVIQTAKRRLKIKIIT